MTLYGEVENNSLHETHTSVERSPRYILQCEISKIVIDHMHKSFAHYSSLFQMYRVFTVQYQSSSPFQVGSTTKTENSFNSGIKAFVLSHSTKIFSFILRNFSSNPASKCPLYTSNVFAAGIASFKMILNLSGPSSPPRPVRFENHQKKP
jgi:hypothetical protein